MHCTSNIYIKINRPFPHFRFDSKDKRFYNFLCELFPL